MNIGGILKKAYEILKSEEIDSYIIDSQLLLCKVLKRDKVFIIVNRDYELTQDEEELFLEYINRRKNRMPIKYILEECEFMGLSFFVKEGVLIPRPDTEVLVEWAIKTINNNNLNSICDLCSGSGAIGLSVANYVKSVHVDLYDISEVALDVSKENIRTLSINNADIYYSDLLTKAIKDKKTYNLLLSNPPYIEEREISNLMRDVKDYEPYIALSGGEDGLYFYRKIIEDSCKVLEKGGYIGFEIGHNQAKDVKRLLEEKGFNKIEVLKDLSGLDRVVTAIYC